MSGCTRRHALPLALLLALLLACDYRQVELLADAAHGGKPGAQDASVVNVSVVVGDAPSDAARFFAQAIGGDELAERRAPRILYPSDGTTFPRNVQQLRPQWSAPGRQDLFEVRIDSELAQLRYYTTALQLDPDESGLRELGAIHAGRSLTLSVRALRRSAPETVYRSVTITLRYSSVAVPGDVYYWSTGAQGVMRAQLSAAYATKFYTDPGAADAGTCTGCHSISRDGRKLALGHDGEHLRALGLRDRSVLIPSAATTAAEPEPMPGKGEKMAPMAKPPGYGWSTFNPAGDRLLVAHKGGLSLFDADTGAALGKIALPRGHKATHPDWAPDGRHVVVSYLSEMGLSNKDVKGTSLARLTVNADDSFGEPEILLASQGPEDTLCFPAYSPDGAFIAYVRATGKSSENRSAELWMLAADGGGEPIALDRLNHRVADDAQVSEIANSMPTWAPSTEQHTYWLAFSSRRDYGSRLVGAERDQLWLAAIDATKLGADEDPSAAAFWLPFQDIDDDNHRALWTPASAPDCIASTLERCDGVDDDCDGQVDESCCERQKEICSNGVDDDCDGLVDDRCGCAQVETCDNALDDDCDSNVDEDCLI